LPIKIHKRVPLEGSELVEYNLELQTRQQREAAQAALIARSKSIIEESDDDDASSDTSDDDEGMEELLYNQFDLYVRDATKSGGFFKQTQSYRMFPYVEKRKRFDDYGEILAPEMFEGGSKRSGSGVLGVENEGRDGKSEVSTEMLVREKKFFFTIHLDRNWGYRMNIMEPVIWSLKV